MYGNEVGCIQPSLLLIYIFVRKRCFRVYWGSGNETVFTYATILDFILFGIVLLILLHFYVMTVKIALTYTGV